MIATLEIRTHFDSAHFLPNYKGKCKKLHGHTYQVIVKVAGEVKDGMVIDFSILKKELSKVINKLDHTLLNNIIENPTAENIAWYIKSELLKSDKLKNYNLVDLSVTVFEGLNNSATV